MLALALSAHGACGIGSEMTGIAGCLQQRLSAGVKQQVEEELLVLEGYRRQFARQGEDRVYVARGQQFGFPRPEPAQAGVALTALDDLRRWMEKTLGSLSTKSETAGAIRYVLSRWRALTRYVDDGLLEIDNNAAERALRSAVMDRKNYLFMGSNSGGERAASLYSLIATAKLNGLDPDFYLRTVLARIPEHPINRIEKLLPWNVAESIQTHSSQAA